MPVGRFIDAGGVRTYFEEYGEGKPLVMLHGDGFNIENFRAQIPFLAAQFRLIIPERRGHGRTPDLPGDYTYDIFAEDAIAFIDALKLNDVHLLGNSGGADIALLLAILRPELVNRLVVVSGESSLKMDYEGKKRVLSVTPEEFGKRASVVVEAHSRVAPDGGASFPALFQKLKRLWTTDWEIQTERLSSIRAPTLVMVADHDFGSIEEAATLFRKIPGAQLCVVPGADHGMMLSKADVVNPIILNFLQG